MSIDEERSEEIPRFLWLSVKQTDLFFLLRYSEAIILVLFMCDPSTESP